MKLVLALVALALLAPVASASERIDGAVLVVVVRDNHDATCGLDAPAACPVRVENDSNPGDMRIDTTQRVQYVGIATNLHGLGPSAAEQNKTIRGNDLYVNQTALSTATDTYNSIPQDRPDRDAAGFEMSSQNVSAYYYGPRAADPTSPNANRTMGMSYGGPGSIPSYQQEGPYNTPALNDTDSKYDMDAAVCQNAKTECSTYHENVTQRTASTTPDIILGFEWDNVQVATDPSNLTDPGARNDTHTSPPLHARTSDPLAQEEHRRHDPDATPLPPPSPTSPPPVGPPGDKNRTTPTGSHVTSIMPVTPVSTPRALVALGVAAATVAVAWLIASLYSRIRGKDALLKNDVRRKIVELAHEQPGVSLREVAAKLGLSRPTAAYHIRLLRQANLLRVGARDLRHHLYPPEAAPAPSVAVGNTQRLVLRALEAAPAGCTRTELHAALPNIPKRSRNHAIGKLLRAGAILSQVTSDRGVVFRLPSDS